MEEINSTQLKLTKSTVRGLSPTEAAAVAGGYWTSPCNQYTEQYHQTCFFYSCQDTHSFYIPHSCFGGGCY